MGRREGGRTGRREGGREGGREERGRDGGRERGKEGGKEGGGERKGKVREGGAQEVKGVSTVCGNTGGGRVKNSMWPLATCWLCLCEGSWIGIILF